MTLAGAAFALTAQGKSCRGGQYGRAALVQHSRPQSRASRKRVGQAGKYHTGSNATTWSLRERGAPSHSLDAPFAAHTLRAGEQHTAGGAHRCEHGPWMPTTSVSRRIYDETLLHRTPEIEALPHA